MKCPECESRSHWDFLESFYQKVEDSQQQVYKLNGHITQMEGHLSYQGLMNQKDRMALNATHDSNRKLEAANQAIKDTVADLEFALHREKQEHRMCRDNLEQEREHHQSTERNMECLYNVYNKLNDLLEQCTSNGGNLDLTDIVVENGAKTHEIHRLREDLKQARADHRAESAILEENLTLEKYRTHELGLLLQKESERGQGDERVSKPKRKRRSYAKDKSKAQSTAQDDGGEAKYADILPAIQEEVLFGGG